MTTEQDIFQQISDVKLAVADLMDLALKNGATSAEAVISKSKGFTVSSRCQELENIEFNQEGALGISVYVGQHKGSASTADLSHQALEQAVKAAVDIAKYTSEDKYAGLVDKSMLATDIADLDLYHPHQLSPEEGLEYCLEAEKSAFDLDQRITNSDGASISSYQGFKVYGSSDGFIQGYPSSRHSISCSVIAQQNDEMQRDYAYTVNRQFGLLKSSQWVGEHAAKNATAMLGAQKLNTGQMPVIFHAEVASSLFGHLVGAISGGSLYLFPTVQHRVR